ncbi:heterokaryon incompatibility protein [Colletotrichum acutatum]|uniref:Heterokaryon incompatibility protein n=1 Tax=Glomerella acutata TaxID=27357 RepID=A0AAD8UHN8_GLOAC|nr:heterokaryon incompatibility protein [Colletotrichum acutatum]KAK1717418.1 heterokaryon incompatibility protein [Colletotrichum acutatum]
MSTFTYDEKLALDEIRLIQLLPGEWLDGLECRLYLAQQEHKYQALSYTWGSSKRSNQITVNGKIHRITFNLDRALRSVRGQTKAITLWVDSICIDQNDAAEKSHQVGLMHSIFRNATEVIAYLGDGLDRSRRDYARRFEKLGKSPLINFGSLSEASLAGVQGLWDKWKDSPPESLTEHEEIICLYGLLMELSGSLQYHMFPGKQSPEQNGMWLDLSEAHRRVLSERMRHFATSDWWNRMWIVQEACVARQLTVVCGRASIPFLCIGHAAQALLHSPVTKHSDLAKVMIFVAGKIDAINTLRLGFGSLTHFTTSNSLLWLLRRFRSRKSSEPRDKIFALLRLAEDLKRTKPFRDNHLCITVDYGIDVGEVFSDAAYDIVRDTGLLWMTTTDLLAKTRIDIPSWVPDWSSEHMVPGFNQRRYRLQEETLLHFNASRLRFCHSQLHSSNDQPRYALPQQHFEELLKGDDRDRWKPVHCLPSMIKYTSSPPFQKDRQRSALILQGVTCGVVASASVVILSDLSNIGLAILQVRESYGGHGGWQIGQRSFFETVVTCLSSSHIRTLVPQAAAFRLVALPKDHDLRAPSNLHVPPWIEDTVRTMAAGNRLFVTNRGQVGLGPESMHVGDSLCVLEGGLVPYILRKHAGTIYTESSMVHQTESIMGTHRFTMVGSCYADGIMHWGDEEHGWGDNADDIERLESKLRRKLKAPELVETAFLLV